MVDLFTLAMELKEMLGSLREIKENRITSLTIK